MVEIEYVCEECSGDIADPTVTQCPHCGHNPAAKHKSKRRNSYLFGAGCFLSVILSPIGILAFWRGRRHAKKAKQARPAKQV